jgi:acyl dehydratase
MDAPGVEVVRPMGVFGDDHAPHGHMHLRFTDVRVPEDNVILGPGRGFEIAQGRLGPGRIHHCMRAIGMAERALKLMCARSVSRTAFGKPLAKLGGNYDRIAEARMNIDMARLLTLRTAYAIDTAGVQEAQVWISKIKAAVPKIAIDIIDDAIQMHGAAGVSQDFPLAFMYTNARTLRLADGPDEVHRMDLPSLVGEELEPSDWFEITQAQVNQFADATHDHQFIHVKPLRAKFTPFRGTIAHGFLVLSMISHLAQQNAVRPEGLKMALNYGSDKVRFLTPVRVGKRIRARQTIIDVAEKKPGHWLMKTEITIDIENEDKPALIAEMLAMYIF